MIWGHRHSWQKMDVVFNEPLERSEWQAGAASHMGQMERFGFTNITFQCRKCPAVKIDRQLGKVDPF